MNDDVKFFRDLDLIVCGSVFPRARRKLCQRTGGSTDILPQLLHARAAKHFPSEVRQLLQATRLWLGRFDGGLHPVAPMEVDTPRFARLARLMDYDAYPIR